MVTPSPAYQPELDAHLGKEIVLSSVAHRPKRCVLSGPSAPNVICRLTEWERSGPETSLLDKLVIQHIKLPFRTHVSHMDVPRTESCFCFWFSLLPMIWEAENNGPSTWVFTIHMVHLDGAPDSWQWPGSFKVVANILGMSQRMEDLSISESLFPSHSLPLCLSYKTKTRKKG